MKRPSSFWLALLWAAAAAAAPLSDDGPAPAPRGWWGLRVDNDLFAGTDRYYTNGVKVFWISPETGPGRYRAPSWIDGLGRFLLPDRAGKEKRFFSVALAQTMFTPEDLSRSVPERSERPYAGFLGAGLSVHRMDEDRLDSAEIGLGVVGPGSLAGSAQTLWHHWFGWQKPKGWSFQLRGEPALLFSYEHHERILRPRAAGGFGRDAVLHAGVFLSNVFTGASAGIEYRLGWNLPADFGDAGLPPGDGRTALFVESGAGGAAARKTGFHFYLAAGGKAVVRDVFLDGNTFRDGPRVEKRPFVAQAAAGAALRHGRLRVSWGYVFLTREFALQRGTHVYATILLSYGGAD